MLRSMFRYAVALAAVTACGAGPDATTDMASSLTTTDVDVYVDPANGADGPTRSGSPSEPWRTIDYALGQVPVGARARVHLPKGQLDVGAVSIQRSSVALLGEGRGATVLVGTIRVGDRAGAAIHDVALKDFSVWGARDDTPSARPARGIDVANGDQLTINNIELRRFKQAALRIRQWDTASVDGVATRQATWNPNNANNKANGYPRRDYVCLTPGEGTHVVLGKVTNVKLSHLDIDTREFGGRGIGGDSNPAPDDDQDYYGQYWTNVEIGDSTVRVDDKHGWATDAGVNPAQFSIEIFATMTKNVRLHHLDVNYGFSLAPYIPNERFSAPTVRIDHTRFDLPYLSPEVYGYTVEAVIPYMEFDHNYVLRGTENISNFSDADADVPGLNVHDNVFDAVECHGVFGIGSRATGLRFANNTVFLSDFPQEFCGGNAPLAAIGGGDDPSAVVSKNLFVSVDPIFFNGGAFHNDNVSIGLRSGVRDNAFFHVKASGENAVVGDPLLNQTGPAPSSYFGLAAGSPVSTYGAYPKGSVVWSVGPDTKDGAGATEGPAPDAVPGPLVNGTVYRLTSSLGSNRALDVASGGTNDGTRVQIWTANGSGAQSWRAIDQGDGTWTFEPGNAPGRALDVGRGNPQPADVQIWTQNRSAAQRWVLRNVPGGGVSLEPVSSPGLRLDVKDSGTSDGTNVQTWPANGTAAQTWFFTPVTR